MNTGVATIEGARNAALLKAIGLDRVPPEQREIALAIATRYELDLLMKHLVLVDGRPYVTRDGLLHVAHRSGMLDGIEVTDPELVDMPGVGQFWRARASVYRKDMSRPFVYQGRYAARGGNQRFAPEMAVKVAEVMALRRAFDVSAPVIEERWDMDATEPQEPLATVTETIAAKRAAISAGPAPLVPREAGSVAAPELLGSSRPEQEEVRDDPQGEPPPPDDAGAPVATGSGRGNPTPAPDCLAPSPYDDGKVCVLKAGHRNAHRSDVATWT
jgi:hypothetical protein